MKLYVSTDDGRLYSEQHIDLPIDPDYFWAIEVPDEFTLRATQLLAGNNDIADMLLKAKIAKKL